MFQFYFIYFIALKMLWVFIFIMFEYNAFLFYLEH